MPGSWLEVLCQCSTTCFFLYYTPLVRALLILVPCNLPANTFGSSVSGVELIVPAIPKWGSTSNAVFVEAQHALLYHYIPM